jgi:hypothetical protein
VELENILKWIWVLRNLKDIASYCKMHQFTYLTTLDSLCKAVKDRLISENVADEFIKNKLGFLLSSPKLNSLFNLFIHLPNLIHGIDLRHLI